MCCLTLSRFKTIAKFLKHPLVEFLEGIDTGTVTVAEQITERMEVKTLQSRSAMKVSQCLITESLALPELQAEQICQILSALLAFRPYVMTHDGVMSSSFIFMKMNFLVMLLKWERSLYMVLDASQLFGVGNGTISNKRTDSARGTAFFSGNSINEQRSWKEKSSYRPKRGK